MRLDADKEFLLCDYCGNIHFPDPNSDGVRVLDVPAPEQCPICSIALTHAAIGSHRILYCTRCRGMLISMETFMPLVVGLRSRRETGPDIAPAPDWNGLKRHIRCPRCAREMDTHPYGGPGNVIIDDCEHCSVNWLDYGELQRIARAPDGHYAERDWVAP